MPPVNIDPIQIGQLIEAVKNMNEDIKQLNNKVDTLQKEVQSLIDLRNNGKGILMGLMIAGGSLGAAVTHVLEKIK